MAHALPEPMLPVRFRRGIARFIASGGGLGLAPRASGTVGAAGASIVGSLLLLRGPWALGIGIVLACALGFSAITRLGVRDDPGWIVIDEVAGQWVALLAAFPPTLPNVLAAFLLFRAFDIAKPGPVHWLERLPGASGIIADDLLAGVFAAAVLVLCRAVFPALFGPLPIPT